MGVFDTEFLTVIITTFVISRIDPVVDLVKRLLSGLNVYLPPNSTVSKTALKPIPKNCKDQDAFMNEQIKDVPHTVKGLLELGKRDMGTYHFRKLVLYDYFWTILFLLGTSIVLVGVVFIRTFIIGVPSSNVFHYVLVFLCAFCIMSLIVWIRIGEKRSSDVAVLLFFFIFSVIYCLCLMSISNQLLGIDLYSSYKELESRIISSLSSIGIQFHPILPKDLLAAILAVLIGCIPPLFVSCGFRYAQLQLQRKSLLSFITFHLPLVILIVSCPPLLFNKLEGTVVFGILITPEKWYLMQSILVYVWIVLRMIEFKPLLQIYLNEGKGNKICDSIGASMIDSIRNSRYNPGSEQKPIKYPNALYYIPNWIFAIAIQLCAPVIMIGIFYTLSITIANHYPYQGLMNWISSYGFPHYPSERKEGRLMIMCKELISKVLSGVTLESFHLVDSHILGTFVSFLFFYIMSSYYFLQFVGSIYWKNRKDFGVCL